MNVNLQIALMVALLVALAVGSYHFQKWLWSRFLNKYHNPPRMRKPRESIKCPPEQIRPIKKKGSCGIDGCKISVEHSHVLDLAKRLKEDRKP